MNPMTGMLEGLALTLLSIHFAVPLAYYVRLRKCLSAPWRIRLDPVYKPKVSVLLPTYNEADLITERLENLRTQDYPRDQLRFIIADSSSDGTGAIVEEWCQKEGDARFNLIRQSRRMRKIEALQRAVSVAQDSEIVILTDADVTWEPDAISTAVRYLSDPSVGAVTASIEYVKSDEKRVEKTYRHYFNIVRISESKVHSTPIHNGPFLAIRLSLMHDMKLPMFEGADDCAFGSFVALTGHRAIQVEDVVVKEPIRGSQLVRMIRRGQLVLSTFTRTRGYVKEIGLYEKSLFDRIWAVEWWLHVVNPWVLVVSGGLLTAAALLGSLLSLVILTIGIVLMNLDTPRTWVTQQIYLVLAAMRNLWTKDLLWSDRIYPGREGTLVHSVKRFTRESRLV